LLSYNFRRLVLLLRMAVERSGRPLGVAVRVPSAGYKSDPRNKKSVIRE
jgi:hypothetical protein